MRASRAKAIVGLDGAAQAGARRSKQPFDYDREIEGMRALDRYTLQFKLEEPRPRFVETLAGSDLFGAVAREVVEFYGDQIDAHPVGTGPFRLAQWRRSSLHRARAQPRLTASVLYDAEPAADDAEGQALLARFKGRRLPMVDRVEISIIEEEQPRWLSFLNGEPDFIDRRADRVRQRRRCRAARSRPTWPSSGIRGYPHGRADGDLHLLQHGRPGGRRLHARRGRAAPRDRLGIDIEREIAQLRDSGQAIAGAGADRAAHDAATTRAARREMGDYDPARAKALLDLYGYVDRDGDGWRELPDGTPLVLESRPSPTRRSAQLDELWQEEHGGASASGSSFKIAQWPENLKAARAGKLQMWPVGRLGRRPDGQARSQRYDSRQIGGQNLARFKLPALDALYDRCSAARRPRARGAVPARPSASRIAYMPYKFTLNRISPT